MFSGGHGVQGTSFMHTVMQGCCSLTKIKAMQLMDKSPTMRYNGHLQWIGSLMNGYLTRCRLSMEKEDRPS